MPRGSRLDDLGWLQFERLCALALNAEAGWTGAADQRRELNAAGGLTVLGRALPGPVLVRCAWLRPSERDRRVRLGEIVAELGHVARTAAETPRAVVLLANVRRPASIPPLPDQVEWVALGDAELTAAIADRPDLRLRLPSVLGLDGVRKRWSADPAARSSLDVPAATDLARRFVPTAAYERAVGVLGRHRFLVLTGPPEMGKTAIARMIGLALLSDGWEVHECTRPEEVLGGLARRRSQLFIADDAFGSTEYRPDAAERWARELPRILAATDDRHRLIWTSRPAPLRAGLARLHRERGAERFPQPAEVQVDAAGLTVAEKAQILLRHARAAGLSRARRWLVRVHGAEIVASPFFTPERIRRFVAERLPRLDPRASPERLAAAVDRELEEPTAAMAASFAALDDEHRELLTAMLDAPPGPVPERELTAALRRHAAGGLAHAPADLIERMTDHFVRVLP